MSETPLTPSELAALGRLDTPTVCNALELLVPERRGHGYTVAPLVCAFPDLPPMVGYARTATSRAMLPAARDKAALGAQRFAYFDYIAAEPGPRIMVIQDLDSQPGYGAYWGEVQTNIHRALGCLGVVTNGGIRDLDACAEGFQLLAGAVSPSHAFVHLEDFGGEVNVHGMTVASGDLIHADRHGAVVIPHAVARRVVEAAELLTRREAVILATCRRPDFTPELLKKAIGDAEEIH